MVGFVSNPVKPYSKVLDVETGSLLAKLWDARSRPLYPLPNVGFNATDDLVVTDGALWDPRRGVSSLEYNTRV